MSISKASEAMDLLLSCGDNCTCLLGWMDNGWLAGGLSSLSFITHTYNVSQTLKYISTVSFIRPFRNRVLTGSKVDTIDTMMDRQWQRQRQMARLG